MVVLRRSGNLYDTLLPCRPLEVDPQYLSHVYVYVYVCTRVCALPSVLAREGRVLAAILLNEAL